MTSANVLSAIAKLGLAKNTRAGRRGAGEGPCTPTTRGPIPDLGGDPLKRQRALPAHGMPKREEGNPPSQEEEEEEGAPPEQRALPAHVMQGGGRPPNHETASRGPPKQRAPPAHGMQGQGGGGAGNIQPEGERGPLPDQVRTPFMRGLIQEMEGNPQDQRSPPPNARQSEGEGIVPSARWNLLPPGTLTRRTYTAT